MVDPFLPHVNQCFEDFFVVYVVPVAIGVGNRKGITVTDIGTVYAVCLRGNACNRGSEPGRSGDEQRGGQQ